MLNRVTLIGNLGRDPEVRRLENGVSVAKFSVATNESYKDKSGEWQTQTEWHDVVCWRYLADRAETQLKKGSMVYIEGKLTHRKYQDKEGNDRYITEVVAAMFRSLDRRESSGSYGSPMPSAMDAPPAKSFENNTAAPTNTTSTTSETATPSAPEKPNVVEAADDDLPF